MQLKGLLSGKLWLLIGWVAMLFLLLIVIGPWNVVKAYTGITPEAVDTFVLEFGALAIGVYLIMHIVRPFVFVPMTPLIVASGFLFGLVNGFLLSVLGSIFGAVVLFIVARYLFRTHFKENVKGRFADWNKKLEDNGLVVVTILRVNPLIPFDGVGYWAGISNVSIKYYIIGTVMGIIPITFVLTLLGASLNEANSLTLYLSLVLTVAVLGISEIYRRIAA